MIAMILNFILPEDTPLSKAEDTPKKEQAVTKEGDSEGFEEDVA